MLFDFLTYLQPTSYFQKLSISGYSIFPKIDQLPKEVKKYLDIDNNFESPKATEYDMAWQAIQKGYVGEVETYSNFEILPLKDNYRFIKKYFHPSWSIYVLVLRIFMLNNPIKEIKAWNANKKVQRYKYYLNPINYPQWPDYHSKLAKNKTKVSVIIPTLNRYEVLKDILYDLEMQNYKDFEVVVIDQSDRFNPEFYKKFDLDFQIIRQEEKALWLARNEGVKAAKGSIIALSEDDVRVAPDWLLKHLKCLDFFDSKVSAGVFYPMDGEIPIERSFFTVASQFATGNAMLFKDVFKTIGLFDRQFEKQRMGDGEFGMRLHINGIKSVSNPFASCVDVKAPTGGLREMGSWDAFRPSNFFAPRPIPSVTYYFRKYFGNDAARYALIKTVPMSLFSYKQKKNRFLLIISGILTFFLLPFILLQVLKSWTLATKKLNEGSMIEIFE